MNVAHAKPEIRRSLAEGLLSCAQFQREDSEVLAFGTAVHTFVGSYWRHLQALGRDSDLTAVSGLASDAWARTTGLKQSRYREFMELCDRFGNTHLGSVDTIEAIEEPIVWDAAWAVLNCTPDRIDRIDGGDPDEDPTWERITDYKTEQGEMEHAFQMAWYTQMRFLQRPSVQRIDFVLDLIRSRSGPFDPVTYERGELDQWWEMTLQALRLRWASIGVGAPPTGGPACADCARRRTCGAALKEVAAIPLDDGEADQLLSEHRRLDAAASIRWEALRAYYKDRLPRVVNGEEIGFLETREPSFEVTASARDLRFYAALSLKDQDAYVQPASISNRGERDRMVQWGLARYYTKPPIFKARKAEPERRKRARTED